MPEAPIGKGLEAETDAALDAKLSAFDGASAVPDAVKAVAAEAGMAAEILPDVSRSLSPVKDLLAAFASPAHRATVKGAAWSDYGRCERTNIGDHDVEIVDVNAIGEGVELYARVWDALTGERIGYGDDGSVDIERFRFFNPPILVPDGTTRTETDADGNGIQVANFREDPMLALEMSLDHTIKVSRRFGAKGIVEGKVGRTTATFYPQAGSGGANVTCDGYIEYANTRASWATIIGSTNAVDFVPGKTDTSWKVIQVSTANNGSPNFARYDRCAYGFDTSSLGAGTIVDSATFSIYGAGKQDDNNCTPSAQVYGFNPTTVNTLVNADALRFGTTPFCNSPVTYAAWAAAFNDYALNASGLAAINLTAPTTLGVREPTYDVGGTTPYRRGDSYVSALFGYFADATGTTNDPKLVVTYTTRTTVHDDRSCEVTGSDAAAASRNAESSGQDAAGSSVAAEADGVDGAAAGRSAETAGSSDASDVRGSEASGIATDDGSRQAEASGIETTEAGVSAEASGESPAADVRAAEAHGEDAAAASRPAEVSGSLTADEGRSAELAGGDGAAAGRSAEASGAEAAADGRTAELDGIAGFGASRGAETAGILRPGRAGGVILGTKEMKAVL